MSLELFQHAEWAVRAELRDEQPWFVARDVCSALGITNSRDAVARLDDDEKGVGLADTPGGRQSVTFISEAGLYALVLRSDKPEAKFKRWVTHDVLPSIRRTGSYSAPRFEIPDNLADALQLASNIERDRARLAIALEQAQPKVDGYEAFVAVRGHHSVREAAQMRRRLTPEPQLVMLTAHQGGKS